MRMVLNLVFRSELGIEIPGQTEILTANSAKLDETMAKKQNNLLSLLGRTSGEIPER